MKKRILALLLCLCVAAGMLPGRARAAAESPVKKITIILTEGLVVDGKAVELTAEKPYFVNNEAVAAVEGGGEPSGWTAKFTPAAEGADAALTLKDFTISGGIRISESMPIALHLKGQNKIVGYGFVLEAVGDVAITGDSGASLSVSCETGDFITTNNRITVTGTTVTVEGRGEYGTGINAGSLDITGGQVTVTSASTGVAVNKSISVSAGGKLTVTGKEYSTGIDAGSLDITGGEAAVTSVSTGVSTTESINVSAGGKLTATGGIVGHKGIIVDNGTVSGTASSISDNAISSGGEISVKGNSTVTGKNDSGRGIDAGRLTVAGGTVTGQGTKNPGITASALTITGGTVTGIIDQAENGWCGVNVGDLIINGGIVAGKATPQKAGENRSAGIYSWKTTIINCGYTYCLSETGEAIQGTDLVKDVEAWGNGTLYCRIETSGPIVEHHWSETWEHIGRYHYRSCADDGCTSKGYVGEHGGSFTDPMVCSTCGLYIGPPEHAHAWSDTWSKDETSHWHACGGCAEKKDAAAHVYDSDADADCNICGYERTVTPVVPDVPVIPDPVIPPYTGGGTTTSKPNTTKPAEDKKDEPAAPVTSTTTDEATGAVTETTVNPDGSSEATTTTKDGTVATVVTSASGQTATSVALSATSVAAAQKSGEAAILPIQPVRAVQSLAAAPVITVTTASSQPVKVEIPAVNPTPGTVAVLVKADGTEEVIKTSVATADGIAAALPDGAQVKIVENSKTFADTQTHWAGDAVAFVTARELFDGTSETDFAPEKPMTRAMLVTVLARLDGADTAGGETWYSKGVDWAVSKNISDGSDPEGNISREQLAVMLWRYAGSPAAEGALSGFADGGDVSDYAQAAMAWAVANGVINGSSGKLDPQGEATRAQVAQMLKNFIEKA